MSVSGNAFDFGLLRRLLAFVKPYKRLFRWSVVLTLVLAALAPARPLLTQRVLDREVANGDDQGLIVICIIMLALLIVQSSLQYLHTWSTNLLGQKVVRDLRSNLFTRMLRFRLSFFDRTPVGTSVTRNISDMETIADIFSEGIIVIIGDLLQLIAIITVMFVVDWRLALISLSTLPILIAATNVFKNAIKTTFGDVRNQVAALNTFVQEHLTGMRIVQVFGREAEEYARFKTINDLHRKANNRSVWYYSIFFPVVEILSAVSIGLIVWWGAGNIVRGEVSFGSVVAFIMYVNMLFRPMRELADKFNTLQMGMVSTERIFALLDSEEDKIPEGNHAPGRVRGEITFKDVWFRYDRDANSAAGSDDRWVLQGLNFSVKPGETVAIVGPTGAGKTSIVGVLNRFYEPEKGSITLDGVNVREYSLDGLRSQVGLVMQDVFLFSDSIGNNISLGHPEVTAERIRSAAEALGAADFIQSLPGGFDFNVQERGSSLSTGQRQVISFVRAYAYDPPVLVLDEATSSVDPETEELITRATLTLTRKRTALVIAHRLATIQNADRIIVLDKGRIVETGSHAELLAQGGMYSDLYRIQFEKRGHTVA